MRSWAPGSWLQAQLWLWAMVLQCWAQAGLWSMLGLGWLALQCWLLAWQLLGLGLGSCLWWLELQSGLEWR